MKHTIMYYAPNDTMGDTMPEDCEAYREWALSELKAEYPNHYVMVSSDPSYESVHTTDEDRRDEIVDFCSRLWDRCPW